MLLIAFLVTLLTVLPIFGINAIFGDGKGVIGAVVAAIVNFLLSLVILYWGMPDQHGSVWGWAWVLIPLLIASLFPIIDFIDTDDWPFGSILGVIVVIVMGASAVLAGVWSEGRAKALAAQADVQTAPESEVPPSDPAHIVQIPEDVAVFKAKQSMASGRYQGDLIETTYRPGEDAVLQSIGGHLYWIVEMYYAKRSIATAEGAIIPGYIQVDAEDPDAPVRLVTDQAMTYVPGGWYDKKLERAIYNAKDQNGNGVRGYVLDDITIEVDDNGKPWYTFAGSHYLYEWAREGLYPEVFFIFDPATGDLTSYELDEIPAWVDRVFSASTVTSLMNNWGEWNAADYSWTPSWTPANRTKVAGTPGLVYTQDGRAVWQVIMTSYNTDTAGSAIIYVDARTGEATQYETDVPITIESNVQQVILDSPENLKGLWAANPQIYFFYDRWTWAAALQPNNDDDSTSFAGIAILAVDETDASSVIIADTMDEALTEYRRSLTERSSEDGPERTIDELVIEGTVLDVGSAVVNGDENFFITLANDDQVFVGRVSDDTTLVFVKSGDSVRIRYIAFPGNELSDVVSVEILERADAVGAGT